MPENKDAHGSREASGERGTERISSKRPSRTVREIKSALAALQVMLSTELDLAKREILNKVLGLEKSVDALARELERRKAE